jgi:hypothetical protein
VVMADIQKDAVEEAAHGLSGTNKRATSTRGVTGCATPIYAKRLTRSGPDVNDDTAGPEPIIGSTSFVACARAEVTHLITEFARDSLLEGTGFELPVPREIRFVVVSLLGLRFVAKARRRAAACDRSKLLPGAADGRGWSLILAFLPALLRDKVPLSRRPGNRTIDGKGGGHTESINSRPVNPATGCMLPIPARRPLSMQPDLSIFSG